jgi:D-alanine-D-alanine ligase
MDNKGTLDQKKKLKIAVLMGGNSAERDVSLSSGAGIIKGLRDAGHEAFGIDSALGPGQLEMQKQVGISGIKPDPPSAKELALIPSEVAIQTVSSPDMRDVDLVFIALHGGMGENGTIQAVLDILGLPYTGSGVLASSVAMDKYVAKKVFIASGIPTPVYFILDSSEVGDERTLIARVRETVGFPVVVKPNDQGSSVGLDIANEPEALFGIAIRATEFSSKLLFEKFIPGRELTVAVLDNQPLPVVEMRPHDGFYDYHHKYTAGMTEYLCPAPLTEQETQRVQKLGLDAFMALNCRGYARIDFRMSPKGEFYCLEVNTLPGMTATSLVPKAAKAAGIEFPELLERIARSALKRGKGVS